MGLLDILNGLQNPPRDQRAPGSSGGMSPMMLAMLGLLAYKAFKGSGTPASPGFAENNQGGRGDILGGLLGGSPGGRPGSAPAGGGLADMIPGGLGGLLGGAAAGSVLSGGLGNIIKELQQNGQGDVAQSWVGTGPNQQIGPDDLANALGADTLRDLSQRSGMSRDDLVAGLSQHLPDLVDQLTPKGRLPTEEEASRWV